MITNKYKRIEYLGFDDRWFAAIGVLLLGLSASYLFNLTVVQLSTIELIITFVASLFFSASDWLINRLILIRLRIIYPSLKDSAKRVTLLFIGTLLTVTIVDFVGVSLISLFVENVSYDFQERARSLVVIVFLTTMIMAIYEAIYFFVLLKKSVREEEQAKQAIIQAELDTLRNQVQPHFFFNTLNTLRDIIDQSPREDAKQFVDKLSDIYRFLLESGDTNLISLKAELKFAKAYMHIQSERFGDNLKLNWNIPIAIEDKIIAPMSLQLLLENAIKHNVISRSRPLEINISIANGFIVVTNKIQKKSTQLPSTKVGLENIKKRYALITDRPIEIENDGHLFSVSLPLLDTSLLEE
ncbi:Histidine kinase [Algoriphagus locisalis]|uniref:Histidine kinase n=1 Tax=Algoriphagus locisalis TaxID=305507 RepID=A0A1I7E4H0_9BACT|nr:histidine kinase [Algoriphagus locisalis]SFU18824.1 Histidine kinase [Algoriphagus locisalis]